MSDAVILTTVKIEGRATESQHDSQGLELWAQTGLGSILGFASYCLQALKPLLISLSLCLPISPMGRMYTSQDHTQQS